MHSLQCDCSASFLAEATIQLNETQGFIHRFLASGKHADANQASIIIDTFGDSPEIADVLLGLVLSETKTATCLSLYEWQHDMNSDLTPGTLTVILDGKGHPRCVIETTHIAQMAYQDVPADFARLEGEHHPLDLPDEEVLRHWRETHWEYFKRKLIPMGYVPTMDMPVLCEQFQLVYAEPPN